MREYRKSDRYKLEMETERNIEGEKTEKRRGRKRENKREREIDKGEITERREKEI